MIEVDHSKKGLKFLGGISRPMRPHRRNWTAPRTFLRLQSSIFVVATIEMKAALHVSNSSIRRISTPRRQERGDFLRAGMRLSLTEAAQKVEAFPNSWLQVVRADVREKLNAPDAGTRLFERMKNEKWICQDAQPHMYAYRQSRAGKKFVSLIAAMEISPTVSSALLRFQKSDAAVMHQTWLRDKELTAHAEIPVLAFHPNEELSDVIQSATNERPLAHFVGKDGATHTVWACKETERVAQLVGQLNSLVILSGDEMFARASHLSNSASVLRAVALTAIERVSIRASRILVSGGDANLLEIKLGQFQDANVRETPENVGDPPPGFLTHICSTPNPRRMMAQLQRVHGSAGACHP